CQLPTVLCSSSSIIFIAANIGYICCGTTALPRALHLSSLLGIPLMSLETGGPDMPQSTLGTDLLSPLQLISHAFHFSLMVLMALLACNLDLPLELAKTKTLYLSCSAPT